MKLHIAKDTTDYTVNIFIQDSSATTGAGLAGLDNTKVTCYYSRIEDDNDVTVAQQAVSALSAITDAHSDGGFIAVDGTNMPGLYRLDLPDAVFATGATSAQVMVKDAGANNVAPNVLEFQLISVTRGLSGTALPAAAADAAGGLPISDAGGLDMDAILVDTNSLNDTKIPQTLNLTASGNIGIDWANVENPTTALDLSATDIQLCDTVTTNTDAITVADILTTAMTESYAAQGATMTVAQALHMIWSVSKSLRDVDTTTPDSLKLDDSTTAMSFLTDSATAPTEMKRT